jgi:hypothetical protein
MKSPIENISRATWITIGIGIAVIVALILLLQL